MIAINNVVLVGKVSFEPTIVDKGATPIAKFSLDIPSSFIGRDGQKVETHNYVKCEAYNKVADVVKANVHQGDRICVEGYLKSGKYTDKNGNNVQTLVVSARDIRFDSDASTQKPGPRNVFPESSANDMMGDMTF